MNKWKDYSKPPFFTDEFNPGMIWDAEFEMVSSPTDLMECAADNNVLLAERVMENVVEAINAKCEGREPKCTVQFEDVKYSGSDDSAVLYFTAYGDKMSIEIRGWGMLTASRKLSPDDAAAVQDSLGQFIADSLIEASNKAIRSEAIVAQICRADGEKLAEHFAEKDVNDIINDIQG